MLKSLNIFIYLFIYYGARAEEAVIPSDQWSSCFQKWFIQMKKCLKCYEEYVAKPKICYYINKLFYLWVTQNFQFVPTDLGQSYRTYTLSISMGS